MKLFQQTFLVTPFAEENLGYAVLALAGLFLAYALGFTNLWLGAQFPTLY